MGWLEDMNRAMDYIEAHLEEKTDYQEIARAARCSVYHFQRLFTFMTDRTLSEYIRKRKMTLAAFEIETTDIKIIDLAAKYGYESPEAFTRAFQALHGVAPSAARKSGVNLKAFPRVSFQLTVRGVEAMNYRIEEKEAFQVYGIEGIFDTADGENLKDIPQFWLDNMENGAYDRLVRSANAPAGVHAVCGYRPIEGTRFPYMLCVFKTPLCATEGYTVVDVPKATWAIFRNEPHSIEETSGEVQNLIARAYTEWLPTANYTFTEGYEFEVYYEADGRFYEEAWIRVTPK